jgi:competence protein ComEA
MESDFSAESSEVIAFIRRNALIVLLGALGLIFLGIGLIQFLVPEQKVEVLSAQDEGIEKDVEKRISKLVIDVAGAVNKPGVYEFAEGSRIKDAITVAGGLSEDADRTRIAQELNLALSLQDGIKVYIPRVGETQAISSSNRSGKININTAAESELDTLSGVGPKTVEKIIAGRPYTKLEELVSKKVIGQATFEKIQESITVY